MKILIVDDHPTNRKLLKVTLEAEGLTTVEAANGLEALAALQAEHDQFAPVDAIISDIFMPGMDGFRFCDAVRKNEQFGHLPFVIYTSTYTSPGDEKLAMQAGADRYLRKPCPTPTLVTALLDVAAVARTRAAQRSRPAQELELTREYNQALVKKLEEKNADLERVAALQKTVAELSQRALAASPPIPCPGLSLEHRPAPSPGDVPVRGRSGAPPGPVLPLDSPPDTALPLIPGTSESRGEAALRRVSSSGRGDPPDSPSDPVPSGRRRGTRSRPGIAGQAPPPSEEETAVASGASGLDTLFDEAACRVAGALHLDRCAIWEALPDGETLRLQAHAGWPAGEAGGNVLARAGSSSPAGLALQSVSTVVVENLATDERFRVAGGRALPGEPAAAHVAVVIPGLNRPFGILQACAALPRTFAPEDVHFLETIANVLATALRRQRAEDEVFQARNELATLLAISEDVASTLDVDSLLAIVADRLARIVPYTGLTVYQVAGRDDALLVAAHRGAADGGRDQRAWPLLSIDETAGLREVIRTGEPVLIPDVTEDSPPARAWRLSSHPVQRQLMGERARCWLGVPLRIKDQVIGVLRLSHDEPGRFSEHDAELAMAFARHAAMAMENARLYEQAREMAAIEERQRLARDLHDAVSQTLFSASLVADVLPRIWDQDPAQVRHLLEELKALTRGARAEMRTLLWELRPQTLLEASLDQLVQQLAEAVAARAPIKASVTVEGAAHPLPSAAQVGLYRIVQESLNNVVKHANAQHVSIRLCWPAGQVDDAQLGPKAGQVTLFIEDDGRGFDPRAISSERLGLKIMRERATEIDAEVTVASQPGAGTRVSVAWPAA